MYISSSGIIAKLRECVLAAGTENADQARDTDLPLKERFFIQPLSPTDAAQRAKFSAQDIIAVKSLIDKKAWPYVQNGLRSSAGYLRYDLNTVISSKTSKDEKKYLKALSAQLFDSLNAVSHFFPHLVLTTVLMSLTLALEAFIWTHYDAKGGE